MRCCHGPFCDIIEDMNAGTVEMKPETAKKLVSLAQTKGVSVDELLYIYVPGLAPYESQNGMSGADRAQAFRAWAASHSTITPPLSDEAISRRSIYER